MNSYEGNEDINLSYLRDKLKDYFGNKININENKGDYIISFIDSNYKGDLDQVLNYEFKEDRDRIIEAAANIIREDIRSKIYIVEYYPSLDSFLQDVDIDIPPSLKFFLEIVIKTDKKSKTKNVRWDTVVKTLSHCIISAVRPKSFISPVLLGLSTLMHKKHGSKKLVKLLSNVGLCSSYLQTTLFESSIIKNQEHYSLNDAYIQYCFDNADHDTNQKMVTILSTRWGV